MSLVAEELTMAPIDQLVDTLAGVGIKASMEAAELNLPGVWIAVDELRTVNLANSLELRCQLFLIVGDTDPYRAMARLVPLYTAMLGVITPDGPTVTQGVVLPGDPTPMPALRVPLYLYT